MTTDTPALTDTQAKLEAARCLMCDDPLCVAACPADVPVKHFIRAIRFDNPRRAINLIRDRNIFAGVCGLACPVDELCVGACASTELSTPIAIGKLQHYAAVTAGAQPTLQIADRYGSIQPPDAHSADVAIIGAGPSGLAAAAELARRGHRATIFEKNALPGGICTYGVPAHRIPQELVAAEVDYVRSLGVEINTSTPYGQNDVTLEGMLTGQFKAVYVAAGAQQVLTPGIEGENLTGVTNWKDLLDRFSRHNLSEGDRPTVARRVIIVGGGSVAMDTASAAHELGAEEIDIVCLEAPNEMPAYHDELKEIWDAGARFHTRSMPLAITGDAGHVTGLEVVRIRWDEPGRLAPDNAVQIVGTEYWLPAEMVIFAIGAKPDSAFADALPGVKLDHAGRIIINPETGATSRPGVYAGGDVAVNGGMTIVKAVAEGRRAGAAIDAYLRD